MFAVVNYLCTAIILGVGAPRQLAWWAADNMFIAGSLLLVLLPVSKALSVDRLLVARRERRAGGARCAAAALVSPLPYMLVALTVGGAYLNATAWKISSPMHLSGLGAWAPTTLPWVISWDVSWIFPSKLVAQTLGYGSLVFESCFLALIWLKKVRPVLLVVGVLFHIGVLTLYAIPNFALVMLAFYVGLLPPGAFEALRRFCTFVWKRPAPIHEMWLARRGDDDPTGPMLQPSVHRGAIGAMLLTIWTVSIAAMIVASPVGQLLGGGDEDQTRWSLHRVGQAYAAIVYPWTGFGPLPLFIDPYFQGYTTQTQLVWKTESSETVLPMTDERGFAGPYGSNRWMTHWWLVAHPGKSEQELSNGLKRFVTFWAVKNGVDLTSGTVEIRQRPLEVSLVDWRPELLHENLARQWRVVGSIQGSLGDLQASFNADARF